MAYNARTGITTYDQADPAADPNVDTAAEIAPSTATSFPSAGGYDPNAAYVPSSAPNIGFWGQLDQTPAAPPPSYGFDTFTAGGGGEGAGMFAPATPQPAFADINAGTSVSGLGQPSDHERIAAELTAQGRTGGAPDLSKLTLAPAFGKPGSPEMENIEREANSALNSMVLGAPLTVNEMFAAYLLSQNPDYPRTSGHMEMIDKIAKIAIPILFAYVGGMAGPWVGGAASGAVGAMESGANSFEDIAKGAGVGALSAGAASYAAPYLGGGMLGMAGAQGLAAGGIAALRGEDPLKAGLTGAAISAGSQAAAPYVQSALDSFSPDIAYAADTNAAQGLTGDKLRTPTDFNLLPAATPGMFDMGGGTGLNLATAAENPAVGGLGGGLNLTATDPGLSAGMLSPLSTIQTFSAPEVSGPTDFSLATAPTAPTSDAGLNPAISAESASVGGLGTGLTAPAPTDQAPGMLSQAAQADKNAQTAARLEKLAKVGANLAKLNAGQGVPQGAPAREDGQDDATYSQNLANYVSAYVPNVDSQSLLKLGLTPGTPEYYDYLMGQLDTLIDTDMQGLDVNAKDLERQLRSKTRDELDALRSALYVRGQLQQLMGSGAYTDPITGRTEQVDTGGARVNPGVAAYHRGLGRTIEEFSQMTPIEQKQAIGGFLGREVDPYGMQARADERAQQEAQYSAYVEDLKRRGMFGTGNLFPGFSTGSTGDPFLDSLLGMQFVPQ